MEPCTDQQSEDDTQWKDEEQRMFEPLCERLLCAVSLLQTSLSEMLDLKDELMAHSLPSSLTTRLCIASGRLFRSVSDLSVPSMELVRLVQVHSSTWEQKKKILEKLHSDYERKQSYLSVALRRLQLLETQSCNFARYQHIGNWERLFTRLMSAQSVGRKWRLRVEALRKTAVSREIPELMVETPRDSQKVDIKDSYQEKGGHVVFAERNSPRKPLSEHEGVESEEDMEEPHKGSADSRASSQSPTSDVSAAVLEEGMTEDGNVPIFIETQETGAQTEVQTVDRETWTGESLIHRFLCVSVSPVLGASGKGFSCRLTFGKQTHHVQLTTMPLPRPPQPLPLTKQITIQEKGTVLAARKTSTGAVARGVGTPNRDTPAGILRRGALAPHREATFEVCSDEVKFEVPACPGLEADATLDLALYHETEGIVATGELHIPWAASEAITLNVPLIGAGIRTRSPLASLGLNLLFKEEELPRFRDQLTQAWSVHEVVREATGIDLQLTSIQELQSLLQPSPEVLEASTSPFPGPAGPLCQDSSTSPMPGPSHSMALEDVPNPTMDYQDQHLLQEVVGELRSLQNIPERDLQILLNSFTSSASIPEDAELLQRLSQIRAEGSSQDGDASKRDWVGESPVPPEETEFRKPTGETARLRRQRTDRKDVSRSLLLRKALPTDVWQRMKYLQDIMQKNKQNTLEKLRSASSECLERQLSSQRRIQAPSEQDTGSQDDVCLPALYMPTKLGHLFTPKAHLYFHPSGSGSTLRLTQPPSVLSLPPLSGQNKLSVLNLLDPRVTLPSFQGQRKSGKKMMKGVSPEGNEDPSALSKEIQEISNRKDLPEHFVGVALEDTESFYSLHKGTEENTAKERLSEKLVADVSESRETFSILGGSSEKTLDGKELIEKVVLELPKLTEVLSNEEKGIGEILVDEQLLEYVA
ncbi:hypothetical protein NDU88_003505 [Pleurodeles waltl]|uniref:Uncharacterized protein n=1 Tax=Pleurodeles waltl TaxID=8319 RepID=A0AAV7TPC6_PLEWA|nr:hypothetical protein NDU88_003505 [Pleurodeles waltl]